MSATGFDNVRYEATAEMITKVRDQPFPIDLDKLGNFNSFDLLKKSFEYLNSQLRDHALLLQTLLELSAQRPNENPSTVVETKELIFTHPPPSQRDDSVLLKDFDRRIEALEHKTKDHDNKIDKNERKVSDHDSKLNDSKYNLMRYIFSRQRHRWS